MHIQHSYQYLEPNKLGTSTRRGRNAEDDHFREYAGRSLTTGQWFLEPGVPMPGRRSLQDESILNEPRPGRAHIPQPPEPNKFGTPTRRGKNAEGDHFREYTSNSLKTGQSQIKPDPPWPDLQSLQVQGILNGSPPRRAHIPQSHELTKVTG